MTSNSSPVTDFTALSVSAFSETDERAKEGNAGTNGCTETTKNVTNKRACIFA
jgi:hypothetical protein